MHKEHNNKDEFVRGKKRQRKRAPKCRSGCTTCKIRRIKCDEAKPNCQKCTSTGRKCDGYTTSPSPAAAGDSSSASSEAVSPENSTCPLTSTDITTNGSTTASWGALTLTLPNDLANQTGTGTYTPPSLCNSLQAFSIPSSMARAYEYFMTCASVDLASPFCIQVWGQYVLGISAVSPAVQHGVAALSGFHELMSLRRGWASTGASSSIGALPSTGASSATKEENWRHYYLAVKETNKTVDAAQGGVGLAGTAREEVLVSCAIFVTIEVLLGNLKTALRHLEGAFALLRTHFSRARSTATSSSLDTSANNALLSDGKTTASLQQGNPDNQEEGTSPVYFDDQMADLIGFFARLDLQMLSFLPPGQYTAHKTSSQQSTAALPQLETPLPNPRSASLFRIVKESLYWLRRSAVPWKYSPSFPADVYDAQARLLRELQSWRGENYPGEQGSAYQDGVYDAFAPSQQLSSTGTAEDAEKANLLLAQTLTSLKLLSALSPSESAFLSPSSLHAFSAILSYASTILAHRNHSTSTSTTTPALSPPVTLPPTPPSAPPETNFGTLVSFFSLEISTVEALYYTAVKCRDTTMRHRALELLRCSGREGVWDGGVMAKVAGWAIGVEEEGVQSAGNGDGNGGLVSEVTFTIDTEGGTVEVDCGWFLARRRSWRHRSTVLCL